jgi:hypothetical protein
MKMAKNKVSKAIVPNTFCDLVTSKSIYVDGKKVGGIQSMHIEFDIDKPSLQTIVSLRFAIKRGSLHIDDVLDAEGKVGLQEIHFSTLNEAFK